MKLFYYLLFLLLASPVLANAQQSKENIMYSSGRIYVVIAVLLIILFGLIFYLIRLEKKLNKAEKENQV